MDFFEGYTFNGDIEYPLSFELVRDTGLTYKIGYGQILNDKKIIKEFFN